MGKLLIFLVFGAIIAFGTFSVSVNEKVNDAVDNAVTYFERSTAHEIVRSVVGLGLRELHDDVTWRDGFTNLVIDGGTATLTVRDSMISGDSTIVLACASVFGQESLNSVVIVKRLPPGVPGVVRGALTAFGPIDKLVSDMVLDGRNHDVNNNLIPGTGTFGVSTGQPTFTNVDTAMIGGTDYTGGPPADLAPAFPESPLAVEVNSSWPNGWPTTPDAALGLSEGSLKSIALSGVGGSRYVTTIGQLNSAPIRGVTFIEVPPGTKWTAQWISTSSPEGIFVFHSSASDAWWWRIKVENKTPFRGIMLFDRVFHFHMDVLGALIHISPNTETSSACVQNKDHWINYSEQTIKDAIGFVDTGTMGSWQDKLEVVSWWE